MPLLNETSPLTALSVTEPGVETVLVTSIAPSVNTTGPLMLIAELIVIFAAAGIVVPPTEAEPIVRPVNVLDPLTKFHQLVAILCADPADTGKMVKVPEL